MSEGQPEDPHKLPSGDGGPLITVNLTFDKLAEAVPHLTRFLNNVLIAISRGAGAAFTPAGRVLNARASLSVARTEAAMALEAENDRFELAKLKASHDISLGAVGLTLEQRAISRMIDDASRSQANRERVAELLVSDLVSDPPTEEAPSKIEDDWLVQFWKAAEETQSDDVQRFYARLLRSEATKPGSISPLTLRALSVLTPEIAATFQHFCCLSIDSGADVFAIHPHVGGFISYGPMDAYGIAFSDLLELEAYGLIRSAQPMMLNYAKDQAIAPVDVDYAGQKAFLDLSGAQTQEIKFTRAGREIRRLLSLQPVPAYTSALQARFGDQFLSTPVP